MSAPSQKFLGRGWQFPPQFDLSTRRVKMVEGPEDVREALYTLVATIPGERLFHPLFGVMPPVFDAFDTTTFTRMRDLIADTIDMYEPRVELRAVTADVSQAVDGIIAFEIDYSIPEANTRDNLVVPFSFLEGTGTLTGGSVGSDRGAG